MASLDAALNRLAIALDALDARLVAAAPGKSGDQSAEIARLTEGKVAMQDEIDRLRAEVRALDDLHDDMSARLDAAMREVQLIVAE